MTMNRFFGAAAVSALLAGFAASSAMATDVEFVKNADPTLSYSSTTGHLTGTAVDTIEVLTAIGTYLPLDNVTITVDASGGALTYGTPTPNPGSTHQFYFQDAFSDTNITLTYTGSGTTFQGVAVTTGEVIAKLTGVTADLNGYFFPHGYSGTATGGINFTFDDTSTPAAGDYTGSFFTWQPGGASVVEDDFTFNDSSKRASLTTHGTGPYTYTLNSFTFNPTGNLSADPEPPPPNSAPEPASWALMLMGVGLVGASMRRRAKLAV